LNLNVGETENLKASINSSTNSGRYISWHSKDLDIATVDDGKVEGIARGNTEIIVKVDAKYYKKCKVYVN